MKKYLVGIGALFGLGCELYLAWRIPSMSGPSPSIASFALWLALDILFIAAIYGARAKGGAHPWLMFGYTTGTAIIVCLLSYEILVGKDGFRWGDVESLTLIAVLLAVWVWKKSSKETGVKAFTVAMVLAGVPTWIEAWNIPGSQDLIFWGMSATGCLLTWLASENTVADRFMPKWGFWSNLLVIALALHHHF